MINRMLRVSALLTTLFLLTQVSSYNTDAEENFQNDMEPNVVELLSDPEVFRTINSIMNAYRVADSGRYGVESNTLLDTKYKTWKRNADLINALLALPKGMTDAGR